MKAVASPPLTISPEQKIYIVDTNVFLHEPAAHLLLGAGGNVVVIPIWVIMEFDKFKRELSERGNNARKIVRQLDDLSKFGQLQKGVELPKGGTLIVDHNGKDKEVLPFSVAAHEYNNDLKILTVAKHYQEAYPSNQVTLVSQDVVLRVTACSLDVSCEDFSQDAVKLQNITDLYSGVLDYYLQDSEHASQFVQLLNTRHAVPANSVFITDERPYPNQCCNVQYKNNRGEQKNVVMIFDQRQDELVLIPRQKKLARVGLNAANTLQKVALHFLLDENVFIVSVSGIAGTGKTLLCLMAAQELVPHTFHRLVIFRPNHELGKELGFLPGDVDQKFNPWRKAIEDNLHLLEISSGQHELVYTVEPINFVRGRTFHNTLIVVDDAQNLTPKEVKTLCTRVGPGSKIIFNGDPDQVDTPYLDPFSNGLSYLIERFKGHCRFAHITLTECERSEVSAMAAELL